MMRQFLKWSAKRHARGTCRAMMIAAMVAKDHLKDAKFYSEYAIAALSTRPGWVGGGDEEGLFGHQSGHVIVIGRDTSLYHVIRQVVMVEIGITVAGHKDASDILQAAIDEVDRLLGDEQSQPSRRVSIEGGDPVNR